jgi:hypothetical protein
MSGSMNEFPIETIPQDKWWSENFAVAFCDPVSGVSIFHSTGRWHSAPTLWREFTMVALPGGRRLFYRGYGRGGTGTGPGGGVSSYQITSPESRAHLTYDGPVWVENTPQIFHLHEPPTDILRIDVAFEARTPLWDMKGGTVEAETQIGSLHTEQIGHGRGHVTFGGETYSLDQAYAVRDHSRGVRDMTHFGAHTWINGMFENGRAFHLYAANAQGQKSDQPGMSNAVIVENGQLHPAQVAELVLPHSDELAQTAKRIVLKCNLGEMEIVAKAPIDTFPYFMVMPFDTTVEPVTSRASATMIDEPVHLEWAGCSGIGWSERGFAAQPLTLPKGVR